MHFLPDLLAAARPQSLSAKKGYMAWAAGLRLSFDPEGVAVSTQALGKNCRVLHASATNRTK
jgi:hypothetical protein